MQALYDTPIPRDAPLTEESYLLEQRDLECQARRDEASKMWDELDPAPAKSLHERFLEATR